MSISSIATLPIIGSLVQSSTTRSGCISAFRSAIVLWKNSCSFVESSSRTKPSASGVGSSGSGMQINGTVQLSTPSRGMQHPSHVRVPTSFLLSLNLPESVVGLNWRIYERRGADPLRSQWLRATNGDKLSDAPCPYPTRIVHEGVTFTPSHENSRNGYFRGKVRLTYRVHIALGACPSTTTMPLSVR
jgi:hypothetical protein